MKWDKYLSLCIGGLGILINNLWGGMDTMLSALLIMMILDFLAGILCGAKHKELDSRVAYFGITKKKMMILMMVTISVLADNITGNTGSFRSITIFYYISMEGLSIIETAGKLGVPIPPKLKEMFIQLQEGDVE